MDHEENAPSASATKPEGSTSTVPNEDDLKPHEDGDGNAMVKDENGFVYYKCRFCGLTFNYINTLRAHERVHGADQPFACGQCGESFHFACELEYHSQQHQKSSGYKCDCGRTFFSYTEMLYHKHPEDGPSAVEVATSTVQVSRPTTAITMNDFNAPDFAVDGFEPKHPMKVYNDVRMKPYICEYCSKSYSDSRGLAYHMYSHRGEKIFNPRASRYLMGRQGIGYTEPRSFLY